MIDNSQLQTYIHCPRLYRNKYIQALRRIQTDEGMQSRGFGQVMHKALALYHTQGKGYDSAIECIKKEIVSMPDETTRTVDNALFLLDKYIAWEKLNIPNAENLALEIKGSFNIGDIEYIVKIDRVIKLNGNIYALDYKTTTNFTRTFFKQFKINMQVDGYCYWVKEHFGQCSGFIPMALMMGYVKKAKLFEPDNVEATEYANTELKYSTYHKQDMVYASGFHCRFDYDIVNRTKENLDDFKNNVSIWCHRLDGDMITSEFPKNTKHCSSYYGCEFMDLCQSLDDEAIKTNLYENYNPLEYLEEGIDENEK